MNGSTRPVVSLQNLTKKFVTDEVETHALSDVSIEIRRGDYVSISGPSGCGKSTLLSIIGLLDTPTLGSYALNGRPWPILGHRTRAHPQSRDRVHLPELQPDWRPQRVRERRAAAHLSRHEPRRSQGARDRRARRRRDVAPRKTSAQPALRGQQQRVAVARAIAGEPSLLLADEPTGNLDSKSGESVMDLLQRIHENGSTICIVTHDPRYARHAQRSINLFDGRVVDAGVAAVV